MMDFPSSPSIGQSYPATLTPGLPVYVWDGVKWGPSLNIVGAQPSNSAPPMDGVAAAGNATSFARGDHVHPTDTSFAPSANPTFTGTLTAVNFNVSGNWSLAVPIVATAKGHVLGNASGTAGSGLLVQADANILLYDLGGEDWCGLGTDTNGNVWVRTGSTTRQGAGMTIDTSQNVAFAGQVNAPTPSNGDNSTKLATTAFVAANQVAGGPYLPLSGGTITGTLTVSYGHVMPYRNGATGVLYLSYNDVYIYYDGGNYILGGGVPLNTPAGRIWGTGDWTRPVSSARLAYVGDYGYGPSTGLQEPWAATQTGSTGACDSGETVRYRQNQVYVDGTWYNASYP